MRHLILAVLLAGFAGSMFAAEKRFDFSEMPVNQAPPGFTSLIAGAGKPGAWKVIMDDVPLAMRSLGSDAPAMAKKSVIAQKGGEILDEHFPILVLGNDTYGDFTFATRFKIVDGVLERMAGIVFRMQDEKNYYVFRASAADKNVRFYKMVNGQIGILIGPKVPVSTGEWHELSVECKGNQIRCLFDGTEVVPWATDNSFSVGKIAFWTKSDSVAHFTDTRITYTPRESLLQTLVREVTEKYPRLQGVKVIMANGKSAEPKVVASNDQKEIGQPGEKNDLEVINKGLMTYRKDNDLVYVTLPLRDRNGDPAAGVRLAMKSFPGQTQENAIVRAMPIVKHMQERVPTATDLTE
jgi:hypothetical protein